MCLGYALTCPPTESLHGSKLLLVREKPQTTFCPVVWSAGLYFWLRQVGGLDGVAWPGSLSYAVQLSVQGALNTILVETNDICMRFDLKPVGGNLTCVGERPVEASAVAEEHVHVQDKDRSGRSVVLSF
jgi:hypothetical protein